MAAVNDLTQNGPFVTLLSSTGGFLKKKNMAVIIGTEASKLDQVLESLKHRASHRTETAYLSSPVIMGRRGPVVPLPAPVLQETGSLTVFTLDLEHMENF